jgi:hypothetical protein
MSPRRRSERALRQIKAVQSQMADDEDDDLEVIIDYNTEPENSNLTILDQSIFTNSLEDIQLQHANLSASSEQ